MKKLLSILLTLIMILCILPLGVMLVSAATSSTSGKVGNYTWSFNESTGKLKLTGSGDMPSFSSLDPPWSNYGDHIKSVDLPNGLKNIGDRAFEDCSNLTSITIPSSVTNIGIGAFSGCSNLTSVTIPNNVTSIEQAAFSDCTSLTSITIPDSVTSIDNLAFFRCISLTSVHITDLAAWCNIYPRDVVLTSGGNLYLNGELLTSVTLPNNVTEISAWSFANCSSLTTVTIPSSVADIGYRSFYDCSSLKSITVYSTDCDFSDDCSLNYTHTIYGFKGSTAESFANRIGATFVDLETVHTHKYTNSCDTDCDVEVCGKTRTIAASAHKFGAWKQTKAPTKAQDGEEKRVCTNAGCTHSEARAIAALGYNNAETTQKPHSDDTQKTENTTPTTTVKNNNTVNSSTSESPSVSPTNKTNSSAEDAYVNAPNEEKSSAMPLIILGACAAVTVAAVIGALIWYKKKKTSA